MQIGIFAKKNDANFVLIHVERDAEYSARKLKKFLKTCSGKAGNPGDARGDIDDRSYFMRGQLRRECSNRPAYSSEGTVEDTFQGFSCCIH